MCVDFRDLSKTYLKDCHSLPYIDPLVDSTIGMEVLLMMDTFQEYHQIPLTPKDKRKICFVTLHSVPSYYITPFSLMNARKTYQRMVGKMFNP